MSDYSTLKKQDLVDLVERFENDITSLRKQLGDRDNMLAALELELEKHSKAKQEKPKIKLNEDDKFEYVLDKPIENKKLSFMAYFENLENFNPDDRENDLNYTNMRRIIRKQCEGLGLKYADAVKRAEDFCINYIKNNKE